MKGSRGMERSVDLKECPVFVPTEAEFKDPIKYISQIRSVAEPFGMCRIVPPKSWDPPFALDRKTFRFPTKVQELHHLQERPAGCDPSTFKLEFLRFRDSSNMPMDTWPRFEGKDMDLCAVFMAVRRRGGYETVTKEKKWTDVVRALFPNRKEEAAPATASQLQSLYRTHLLAYEKHVNTELSVKLEKKKRYKRASHWKSREDRTSNDQVEDNPTLTGARSRQAEGSADRRATRLTSVLSTLTQNEGRTDQLCQKCNGGGHEDLMLLCDRCNMGWHMYCLSPPLDTVPEGNWYCPKCVTREADSFGFANGDDYTIPGFQRHDTEFRKRWFGPEHSELPTEAVEEEFWRIVESPSEPVKVLYGSDIETGEYGSGFPRRQDPRPASQDPRKWEEYKESPWNLNALSTSESSMLRFVSDNIPGVIVPWLYMGMTFSSFCWHFEDHCFYSISYLHWGYPKIWYGVPGYAAEDFEKVMKGAFPDLFAAQPDLLFQLVTMLNPMVLKRAGVPVYRTVQQPGNFVITFPRSYHGGLNVGLNCAEAVNFAPTEWLAWSRVGIQRFRLFRRKSILSHEELLCVALLNMSKGVCTFDTETLHWLRTEGESVLKEERELRERVWAQGTTRSQRLEHHDNATAITDQEDSECIICRYYLYLSGVTCSCRPSEPVCLEHAQNVCDCSGSARKLLYRWSLAEIEDLLEATKCRDRSGAGAAAARKGIGSTQTLLLEQLRTPSALPELTDGVQKQAVDRRRLSGGRGVRHQKGSHLERLATWVSRTKVVLRTPPTLEAAREILQEAEEFLWAGHEADPVREIAAKMQAAIAWADNVARCLGMPAAKGTGAASVPALPAPSSTTGAADTGKESASSDQSTGGLFHSRRMNLSLLEKLLVVKEVPCLETNFKNLKVLHSQAKDWQRRVKEALTADPPLEVKVLHGLQMELNRGLHIDLPEAAELKNALAAAQAWVDAVRKLAPTTKAVRRRAAAEFPEVQQLFLLQEQGKKLRVKVGEHNLVTGMIDRVNAWREAVAAMSCAPPLKKLEAFLAEADALPVRLPEVPLLQKRVAQAREWSDNVAALRIRSYHRPSGSRLTQWVQRSMAAGPGEDRRGDVAFSGEAAEAAFLQELLEQGKKLQVEVPDLPWLEKEVKCRHWKVACGQAMEGNMDPQGMAGLIAEGRELGMSGESINWLEKTRAEAEAWEKKAEAAIAARAHFDVFSTLASESESIKALLKCRKQIVETSSAALKLHSEAQAILQRHKEAAAPREGGTAVAPAISLQPSEPECTVASLQTLAKAMRESKATIPGTKELAALVEQAETWEAAVDAALPNVEALDSPRVDQDGTGGPRQALEELARAGAVMQAWVCLPAVGVLERVLRRQKWVDRVHQALGRQSERVPLAEAEALVGEAEGVLKIQASNQLLTKLKADIAAARQWLVKAVPVANGTTRNRIAEADFRQLIAEAEGFSVSVDNVKERLDAQLASYMLWLGEVQSLMKTLSKQSVPQTTAQRLQELQAEASRTCITSPEKRHLLSGSASVLRWLEAAEAALCIPDSECAAPPPAPLPAGLGVEQQQHADSSTGGHHKSSSLRAAARQARSNSGSGGFEGGNSHVEEDGQGGLAPGASPLAEPGVSAPRLTHTLREVVGSLIAAWWRISGVGDGVKAEPGHCSSLGPERTAIWGQGLESLAQRDKELGVAPGKAGSRCFCGRVAACPVNRAGGATGEGGLSQAQGPKQKGQAQGDVALQCVSCGGRYHLSCLKQHGLHKLTSATKTQPARVECVWCSSVRTGNLALTQDVYGKLWVSRRPLLDDLGSLRDQAKSIPFRVLEMDLLERVLEKAGALQQRFKALLQPVLSLPRGSKPLPAESLVEVLKAVAGAEFTVDASWAPQCQARRNQGLRLLQAVVTAHHWHSEALQLVERRACVPVASLALMLSRGQTVVGAGDGLLEEIKHLHTALQNWLQQYKQACVRSDRASGECSSPAKLESLLSAGELLPVAMKQELTALKEKLRSLRQLSQGQKSLPSLQHMEESRANPSSRVSKDSSARPRRRIVKAEITVEDVDSGGESGEEGGGDGSAGRGMGTILPRRRKRCASTTRPVSLILEESGRGQVLAAGPGAEEVVSGRLLVASAQSPKAQHPGLVTPEAVATGIKPGQCKRARSDRNIPECLPSEGAASAGPEDTIVEVPHSVGLKTPSRVPGKLRVHTGWKRDPDRGQGDDQSAALHGVHEALWARESGIMHFQQEGSGSGSWMPTAWGCKKARKPVSAPAQGTRISSTAGARTFTRKAASSLGAKLQEERMSTRSLQRRGVDSEAQKLESLENHKAPSDGDRSRRRGSHKESKEWPRRARHLSDDLLEEPSQEMSTSDEGDCHDQNLLLEANGDGRRGSAGPVPSRVPSTDSGFVLALENHRAMKSKEVRGPGKAAVFSVLTRSAAVPPLVFQRKRPRSDFASHGRKHSGQWQAPPTHCSEGLESELAEIASAKLKQQHNLASPTSAGEPDPKLRWVDNLLADEGGLETGNGTDAAKLEPLSQETVESHNSLRVSRAGSDVLGSAVGRLEVGGAANSRPRRQRSSHNPRFAEFHVLSCTAT